MELEGFERFTFRHEGKERPVYRRGDGPGVVLIHELPGMTPECVRLAERLAAAGFCIYMPLLFGRPGRRSWVGNTARVCIRREFVLFAKHRTSPVVEWVRALCRRAWEERGGSGVGAIGMCLTGNFAISLMADEALLAPVASQPSLPFAFGAERRGALGIDPEEMVRVRERAAEGGRLLALRFSRDPVCPPRRFRALRAELGDAVETIEIDSSEGNPHGIRKLAHSVLTDDLVDEEGHPTRQALERVLSFLDERLRGASGGDV